MKHISVGFIIASILFVSGSASAQVSVTPLLSDGDITSECLKLETSLLRFGSRDANTNYEVTALQDFLISKDFLTGPTTGYFGRLTVNAVKAYQKSIGVSPTGNVGPLTRAMIFEDSCKGTSSAPTGTGGINIGTSPVTPGVVMATIDNDYGTTEDGNLTIFGKASGLSVVGVVIVGSSGDKVYASGPITVSNNQYQKVIPKSDIAVNPGQYLIYVTDYYKNVNLSSKYLTLGSVQSVKATIDENSGQSDGGVTIFGKASGVSAVGITIAGPGGDKVYGSGAIFVTNGQYKKVIPKSDIAVNPGQYLVYVTDYYTNSKLATGYITIGTEAIPTYSSPVVEVVGTPSITLKYDSNNKESRLVGYIKMKITAGKDALTFNVHNGVPTNLLSFFDANGKRVDVVTSRYGNDEKGNNGNTYTATILPGASELYSAEISVSAKHLFQGLYTLKADNVYSQYGQLILDSSTFKGLTSSKSILVIGETSPYINSASVQPSGEVTLKGVRFHPRSNTVTISGISKVFPSTNNQTNIVFNASYFNLTSGSSYFVYVESPTEGRSNTFGVSIPEGTITSTRPTVSLSSPSVEVVGTPSIALKYDSNNKESLLTGYAKVKITAGKETLTLNITNGAPTNLIGFSSENGNRVGAITRIYGSDEKGNNGNSYIATLRPGESEIYSAEVSASAKHLLQGVYMVKVDSVYGQSGQLVLDGSTYKGETTSKRILVIGETSPNITGVSITPTGEVTIKGTRFHPTSNIVAISGTSKTLPSTNNQTNIVFKASDFNLAVGQYFVTVESASEGKGNTFVFSVDEGTITTGVLSAKLSANPTTVPYLGGYDYFTLSSTGAVSCKLHYKEDPNAAWSVGQGIPSPNYTWKPYKGYTKTTSYYATCTDVNGKTVESNIVTMNVLPKEVPQASCAIADLYAVQVPGSVTNEFFIKITSPPSTVKSDTVYGITGADSWNSLTFTEHKSGDGYKILKATQTLNATGASFVIGKKSTIQLKVGGTVICPAPAPVVNGGIGMLDSVPSQMASITNTITSAVSNGVSSFAGRAFGASSVSAMECTTLERNIHRGDESNTTTKLQQFLISRGFLSEGATGFFGDLTIEAVKAYQRSLGLKESGMVYDMTRQAIMKETCQ